MHTYIHAYIHTHTHTHIHTHIHTHTDREADILAKEYQLSQCRKIITIFSRNNHSIEHFICSYIIQLVTKVSD